MLSLTQYRLSWRFSSAKAFSKEDWQPRVMAAFPEAGEIDKSCIPEGGSGLCSTAWFPNSRSYIKIPEVGAPGIQMCPELVEYHHHQPDPAILYMPFQLWASIEEGYGMSSRRVCKSRRGFILSQEIVLRLHRQKIESRSSCSENVLLLRKKEEIFYFSCFFYSCDMDSRMGRYAILWALSYLQLIFMNGSVGAWSPGRCFLGAIVLKKNL